MAKILTNTTASPVPIGDTGVTIAANAQYTIQPSEYSLWATSDDLVLLVGNTTLTVSDDGATPLSVSEGINFIQGIYPKEIAVTGVGINNNALDVNATVNVAASAQAISSSLRVDFSSTKQDLPKNSLALLDYYTYLGSGTFYNMVTYFNSEHVIVELEVDGSVIFNLPLDKIHDFKDEDDSIPWFSVDDKQITFKPQYGITFNTSIILRAKASQNSSSKDMKMYLVNIEKVS